MKNKKEINQINPLNLAFVGDSVFSLFVRAYLLRNGSKPVGTLHKESVKLVNASKQREFIEILLPFLNEDEIAVYKRGRNANKNNSSKSSVEDYSKATGLEALFGYLYLCGESDRLKTIFEIICN